MTLRPGQNDRRESWSVLACLAVARKAKAGRPRSSTGQGRLGRDTSPFYGGCQVTASVCYSLLVKFSSSYSSLHLIPSGCGLILERGPGLPPPSIRARRSGAPVAACAFQSRIKPLIETTHLPDGRLMRDPGRGRFLEHPQFTLPF